MDDIEETDFDSILQPKKRTIIHNIVVESFAAGLAII
jgi:hypothetical protein